MPPELVALVTVVVLVVGDSPGAQLRVLKDDPLASYEPPGSRLVLTNERDQGTSLGEPAAARYERLFDLPPGDPERQLQRAVEAAVAAGWTLDEGRGLSGKTRSGVKRLRGGDVRMSVTLITDSVTLGDAVLPPALLISLRHEYVG